MLLIELLNGFGKSVVHKSVAGLELASTRHSSPTSQYAPTLQQAQTFCCPQLGAKFELKITVRLAKICTGSSAVLHQGQVSIIVTMCMAVLS